MLLYADCVELYRDYIGLSMDYTGFWDIAPKNREANGEEHAKRTWKQGLLRSLQG